MKELQDIVASYPLMQPVVSFATGACIGTIIRLYQNYVSHKKSWLPVGSSVFGIIFASQNGSGAEMYVANAVAAVAGDYITTKVIDRLPH